MELPKTRSEAIKLKVKYFYCGPCDQGHDIKRFASNGKCLQCNRDDNRGLLSSRNFELPFTEEGLLEAVKGCETRVHRINAMINYYSECFRTSKSKQNKAYIQTRIDWLKEELDKKIPQRMYVTV